MRVIVDTSVWSLALRRNDPEENEYVFELKELIKEFEPSSLARFARNYYKVLSQKNNSIYSKNTSECLKAQRSK